MRADFEDLEGKVISKIVNDGDRALEFHCTDGNIYEMYHEQDCCERVHLDDICGDWEDVCNSKILLAEEVSSSGFEEHWVNQQRCLPDSHTWTFYKIATIKGAVTLRWFGESNGYYSESVDFRKV